MTDLLHGYDPGGSAGTQPDPRMPRFEDAGRRPTRRRGPRTRLGRWIDRIVTFAVVIAAFAGMEAGAQELATQLPPANTWGNPWVAVKVDQLEGVSEGQYDTLILGSSVAATGLHPDVLADELDQKVRAYNAGLPGSSPRTWGRWAEEFAFEQVCPSTVLMQVSIRDYNDADPRYVEDLDAYRRSVGRRSHLGLASIEEQVDGWGAELSALWENRTWLRNPLPLWRYLRGEHVPGWPRAFDETGRYHGLDGTNFRDSEAIRARLRAGPFGDFQTGGPEETGLRRAVIAARRVGAQPVILMAPTMRSMLVEVLPGGSSDYDGLLRSVERVADEYGIPVVRTDDMTSEPRWFGDGFHLNAEGGRVWTRKVAIELRRLEQSGVIDLSGPSGCPGQVA